MPELDRREFLKLVGVGAGAAAAAGCSERVEHLIPYVVQPEVMTPGIAIYYASTCRECPAACGLHVRTREGRPVKLEGNPEHPVSKGSLCARGQVSIGRTYHPDRYTTPMSRGADGKLAPVSWEEAIRTLADKLRQGAAGAALLGGDPGPTASQVLDRWVAAVGASGRVVYEPFAQESLREAVKTLFGVESEPVFDLSQADLVLSFGSDFMETGPSPNEHMRQLAEARDVRAKEHGGARFVYLGPRLSMTASNADEWIPSKPGTEGILALAVLRAAMESGLTADRTALGGLLDGVDAARAAARTGVDAKTIQRLGAAVARAKSLVALPPTAGLSSRRASATAAAVLLLDHAAGAVGRTVLLPAETERTKRPSYHELLALVDAMKSGKVSVLLVHDANPVHSMPPGTGFREALAKVPFLVSFAPIKDETSEQAHLVLPDLTPLESWGDASPRPGVRSLLQPTIRPLYGTRAMVDVLLEAGRSLGDEVAAKLPPGNMRSILETAWAGEDFRKALARGGSFAASLPTHEHVALSSAVAKLEVSEPLLEGEGDYVLLAHPSPLLGDGRSAALPWMQEVPDPVTKVTWNSWVELSHATARRLGVEIGDVLALKTAAGTLEVQAFPRGGIRDDVVAVAVGQGHTVGWYASHEMEGRPGEARGVNVIAALPAAVDEAGGRAWFTTKVQLAKTGRSEPFAVSQTQDNQRDRSIGAALPLAALAAGAAAPAEAVPAAPEHGARGGEESAYQEEIHVPFDPVLDAAQNSPYRWGMTIDVDRCTGCSACVAACYIENNSPIVGEDQVRWGRLMAWLRIERWVGDGVVEDIPGWPRERNHEELGKVDIRHTPMMCQQCGAAPCEPVCPVFATYHNPEGLNGMVYNRCIGTRYCSNNCPYKVRRFNWYDFSLENWPKPLHLMLNPDVTVRAQGVMEKCTYCTQRIEIARQPAKDQKRLIRDGEVITACAQACPTQAITFGNLKDPESNVSKKRQEPVRGYVALQGLNTRPATLYLAKVVRGPVEG